MTLLNKLKVLEEGAEEVVLAEAAVLLELMHGEV